VTGGAGFIGNNFIQYLLEKETSIIIINLDLLTYAGLNTQLQNHDRYIFIQGDICDSRLINTLLQQYGIDTIVHFAAESHVDRSIHDPAPFIRTNIIGTFT